jgi:hypothetical protein
MNPKRNALSIWVSLAFTFFCLATLECYSQPSPPSPGPLTSTYTFQGVRFRYPNNWVVRAQADRITVAPQPAFLETNGKSFVTHGFFLFANATHGEPVEAITKRMLGLITQNTPRIQTDPTQLKNFGEPPWASCGDTLDPNPPYPGTETGAVCTYRVGSHDVAVLMFSPTRDWDQYHIILNGIFGTLSSDETQIPVPTSTGQPEVIPRSMPSAGTGCESGHWIDSVVSDGKIIKLEDGSLWEVDDVDMVDTAIWLPISDVVICGSNMINTDDKESAEVKRIGPSGEQSSANGRGYTIQASSNDETFVINSKVFKSKTYCFSIDHGDRVIFLEGSPTGVCVSAKFLDLRNDKVCEVWCE